MITREQVLENLEQVKAFIAEAESKKEEEKVVGIAIETRAGSLIFQSTKSTYREAVIENGNRNLRDADLRDADLMNAKFYGRGGTKPLKREQLPDFLRALGFVIEK